MFSQDSISLPTVLFQSCFVHIVLSIERYKIRSRGIVRGRWPRDTEGGGGVINITTAFSSDKDMMVMVIEVSCCIFIDPTFH